MSSLIKWSILMLIMISLTIWSADRVVAVKEEIEDREQLEEEETT